MHGPAHQPLGCQTKASPFYARVRLEDGRRGLTLVEMLMVIAILGILMSLLLPAIQRARERARQAQCLSRIRQLSLAVQGFEADQRFYPLLVGEHPRDYSALARLLPYLDEQPIYNSINFTMYDWDPIANPEQAEARKAEEQRFRRMRVSAFLCPADPFSSRNDFGGTNYRMNLGTNVRLGPPSGEPDARPGGNGFFYLRPATSQPGGTSADIRDGLTNTAAFAERVVGDGQANYYSTAADYFLPLGYGSTLWSREEFIAQCSSLTATLPVHDSEMGYWWLYSGWNRTMYNHVLPPNSRVPDCGYTGSGIVSARSWHLGGLNVAMGGGNARFVNENIGLDVWRAIGTRSGGETIGDGSF